nr:hypothetical protein [uncultured Devosia sp.]
MTFLSLRWRIQIVMGVVCLGLAVILVHGRDRLPMPINETAIGMLVGGAFLISILIGMVWHWHSIQTEE